MKILNKKINSVIKCLILLFIIIVVPMFSYSYPPLPTEFYGTITSFNTNAISGSNIVAYYGNVSCGTFIISNSGFYGVLSCVGRDTDGSTSSGATDGDTITFKYNGEETTVFGDNIFTSGEYKFLNITHPKIICGDGFCDAFESCSICEVDCNACNFTGNLSQNTTGNGTSNQSTSTNGTVGNTTVGSGGSGGGSGGGGGGSGGGSGGGGGDLSYSPFPCSESWKCGNWSDCLVLGLRNRTCNDLSNCGTYSNKPKEIEECTYLGTCFDNLINCHNNSCEDGVDCGGPCDKRCAVIEAPSYNVTVKIPRFEIPTKVCERHINYRDPSLWIFLIIIIISIIARVVYDKYYVDKLHENEKLTPLERSRKIRSSKRKTRLFVITVVSLTAIAFLYSYYFLLCPSDFVKYSWMLVVALLIMPFVIHAVMKKYEYSESKHLYKSKLMEDSHYAHIVKLIELENNIIADEENSIANRLYVLSTHEEFRDFMDKDDNIKEIYKNLVRLYSEYKEKKNPFNVERLVCDEINALDSDVLFKSQLEKHSELKSLFDRLKKLYVQYEEKQKLYDQIDVLQQDAKEDKKDSENNKKDK